MNKKSEIKDSLHRLPVNCTNNLFKFYVYNKRDPKMSR